jgi:hypothetical protein
MRQNEETESEKHMASQCRALVRSLGPLVALGVGVLSCAGEPKNPSSATELTSAAAAADFTFAPPPGTTFIRREHRKFDVSLVGAPLSRREEQELTWRVNVEKSGERYLSTQVLTHILLKHNDTTQLDADVREGAVSAQLVIDRAGNLVDVRGLEYTSKSAILPLLAGKKPLRPNEERSVSPEALKTLVAMRYDVLTGNIVGHPAAPGSSWTAKGHGMSHIVSTTLTVERIETCGEAACARIREDAKLDTAGMRDVADDLAKQRIKELGGDPSKIEIKRALYSMSGEVQVEPTTMLNHEATLSETGTLIGGAGDKHFEIAVNGTTQYSYEYTNKPVASR